MDPSIDSAGGRIVYIFVLWAAGLVLLIANHFEQSQIAWDVSLVPSVFLGWC